MVNHMLPGSFHFSVYLNMFVILKVHYPRIKTGFINDKWLNKFFFKFL